jgi:hypothetical protein
MIEDILNFGKGLRLLHSYGKNSMGKTLNRGKGLRLLHSWGKNITGKTPNRGKGRLSFALQF